MKLSGSGFFSPTVSPTLELGIQISFTLTLFWAAADKGKGGTCLFL